tara:strand:+ start:145 stop:582 length:438 start_codon:yes stop_codon:yes gene_type:complete
MFSGICGSKQISFSLSCNDQDTQITITNTSWPVLLTCSQRVSKRLKTCDIIFIASSQFLEITIDQNILETVLDNTKCAHYDVGADPLPWKRIHKIALSNNWQLDDWQHYFEYESEVDDVSDDDWNPEDHESSSDEDSDEDSDEEK